MRAVNIHVEGTDASAEVFDTYFPGARLGSRAPEPFRLDLQVFATLDGLTFMDYTTRGLFTADVPETAGHMIAQSEVRGQIVLGRDEIDHSHPYVVQPNAKGRYDFTHNRIIALTDEAIGAQLGDDAPAPFHFTRYAARTSAHAQHWRNVVAAVRATMATGVEDDPLISAALTDFVVRSALACFPHTSDTEDRGPTTPATAAVRRARAFIEDRAVEPITVADIARAARLSTRHLQTEFKRQLDITPTQYVRRVRLSAARAVLMAGDVTAGVSVAAVARASGFTHMARFASAYREEYGETPRQTLQR
ncbi:helix-turn-helix transcriptional regulator [Microbacterium sp. NPDC091313]